MTEPVHALFIFPTFVWPRFSTERKVMSGMRQERTLLSVSGFRDAKWEVEPSKEALDSPDSVSSRGHVTQASENKNYLFWE